MRMDSETLAAIISLVIALIIVLPFLLVEL